MAHHVEPMDIDSDFDNKENSLHHNNVLPFTEKGYEELDVSELNMKLRYSVTPVSSPMSKSYTANCVDNRSLESGDDSLNVTVNENSNLTRSLNSTMTRNDSVVKSLKALPLQTISTEQLVDSNRNTSVLRALDTTVTPENGNVTVTVSAPSDIDENLSLPSSSSSTLHTPEATTPTKDIPPKDGGSPIMRGLKSVLSMFRTSQSPIPPVDNENALKPDILSPAESQVPAQDAKPQTVLASTPIAAHRKKEMSPTKRNSPQKDLSIVFNEDLEKELQWKDETTIIFSQERIPIHKLMLQQPLDNKTFNRNVTENLVPDVQDLNSTVEYMDISYNDSMKDRTITDIQTEIKSSDTTFAGESDCEFVDCETTFTKNDSHIIEDNDKTPVADKTQEFNLTRQIEDNNDSGSRLKPIILDTTQDILDATLSVRPEDLLPDILDEIKSKSVMSNESNEASHMDHQMNQTVNVTEGLASETKLDDPNATKTRDGLPMTHTTDQTFELTLHNELSQIDHKQLNQTVNVTEGLALETKVEDPNVTKALDGISTTQIIDQTFDLTTNNELSQIDHQILNQTVSVTEGLAVETKVEDPNVTKIFDHKFTINNESNTDHQILNQTVNVAEGLALETKVQDPNVTKTLDSLSTSHTIDQTLEVVMNKESKTDHQLLNQAVNVTEGLALETKIEDPNATKTLASLSTSNTIDRTFELDMKNESLIDNQLLNQTVNVAEGLALETKVEDPNVTKTHDVLSTTQTIDQTFDVSSSNIPNPEVLQENLNATKTKDNILSETYIDQPNETEKLNITLTNETVPLDDKTFNAETTSTVENKTDFNKTEAIEPTNNVPMAPVFIPPALEEILNTTISYKDTEVHKESLMVELPVDIPLPDEDDLDKELNIPTEITTETTIPSLPLDLVDDIKTNTEITNVMNPEPSKGKEMLTEEVNKYEEKALDIVKANTMSECGDNIHNQTFELNTTAIEKELIVTLEKTNLTNEMLEPIQVLPGDTLLNTELVKETVDIKTENIELTNTNIELNTTKNIDMTEKTEEQKDIEVPMDINESITEFRPLPDVINQTIPYTENVESTGNVPEIMPEVVGMVEDSNNPDFKPEEIIVNELLAAPPLNETNQVVEELITQKPFTLEPDTNIIDNQPDEIIKNSNSETEIPVTRDSNQINENVVPVFEKLNVEEEMIKGATEIPNIQPVDEEIILSENNSPFVSVTADDIKEIKPEENTPIEVVMDTVETKTKVVFTPPSSPPIRSKGYNFNFDDLDFDPFATKTNIRMSPPLNSPNKPMETDVHTEPKCVEKRVPRKDNNRRKSQPERKRPAAPKRKLNSTFDGTVNDKAIETPNRKSENIPVEVIPLHPPNTVALSPSSVSIEEETKGETIEIQQETVDEVKLNSESEIVMEDKIHQSKESLVEAYESSINIKLKEVISSSEQSTYYSAGTSSSDTSIQSRNVFNLPEIDDMNFNPFATKSKMRQSPPPDLEIDNPFITKSKVKCSPDSSVIVSQENKDKTTIEDKTENEPMEKEVLANLSSTTTSSKATDEKHTITGDSDQIRTEDEDTVEGPFLEAEDLNTDDKMSDFDGENIDMMQFNELPTHNNDENADNGELFIDAEAFEFLLNQNKSNTVVDSGKESLFLKFDPLFAKRMSAVTSDGVVASLARLQRKQSTPTKSARTPPKTTASPIAGPSNLNVTQDIDMNNSEELNDDLNITVSKPMMVVPPAVNPVTPRNKSLTPNRSNRHSITFTSPAMAVIDRLLSLSSNNSMVHDATVTHVSREQNEADIALSQLRDLLAEKEISVYQLRSESRELRDRLSTLESNVKSLENVCEDRLKKINQLNETLAEKTKINRSMAAVVEEYERTIASLIAETAQDKKRHAEERIKLINERDEQTAHLTSMEVSFSDLHSKYEKSKQIILNCKANEETYKKSIKDFEENFTKMQNNYELLKQHATSKLNHANQEMEKINRSHEAEVLKLNAMIKRKELHITSLEESLNQKTKANEELTAICDELINKVG